MKKYSQKISAFVLSLILVCTIPPFRTDASYESAGICQVQTDVGNAGTVKTLDYGYDNNTYFSLRDIAMILKDTGKTFVLDITKNAVSLNT